MKHTTRRRFLNTLAASSLVIGFDPLTRQWVTSASAAGGSGLDHIPRLDGVLRTDDASLSAASEDAGRLVHRRPIAVLEPASVRDVSRIVRFANQRGLRIATRGHGHCLFGQALVEGGIVINMRSFATARNLAGMRVLADAGCSWREVLEETLKKGATPPVIPDYLGLSVGGTLSIGGISPTTYRYGAQVDNVEALEVVTGEGETVFCSRRSRRELFDAVLAGQGQCAVIVRAVIKLVPAPARVRAISLRYPDVTTALTDADRLIDEQRFDGVVVFAFPSGSGHAIVLRATKYYSPPMQVDEDELIAGLNYSVGAKQSQDLTYTENFSITTDPFPSLPQPAFSILLPSSAATQWISGVLPRLTVDDLGSYNAIQIFAWRGSRFGQPLFRAPCTEEKLVGFALIRYAANAEQAALMVEANRRLFEEARALGGTLYPFSAVKLSKSEWRQHYGDEFKRLTQAKRRYDGNNVLASGPDIF
jgi:cytokinin dehydrogenase